MRRGATLRILEQAFRTPGSSTSSSRLPVGPGCSRWLSCSCCNPCPKSTLQPGDFFSSQFKPTHPTPFGSSHGERNASLPLPPRLPYSPNSRPFQRHMEALSLALYSSPDHSWDVYLSLDPSLRRYIPDSTFKDLAAHQVTHKDLERRASRSYHLFGLADDCGMSLDAFGRPTVETAFEAIAQEFTRMKPLSRRRARRLLKGMLSALGRHGVPLSTAARQAWINVLFHPLALALSSGSRPTDSLVADVLLSTRQFLALGGGVDLEAHIEIKLALIRPVRFAPALLEFHAFCWSQGLNVSVDNASRLLRRLNDTPLQLEMPDEVLERLRQAHSTTNLARANFQLLAAELSEYRKSPLEKANAAIEDDALPAGRAFRAAFSLLDRERRDHESLPKAIRLCERLLRLPGADCPKLVTEILRVMTHRDKPDPDFLNTLLARDNLGLTTAAYALLLELCARHLPSRSYGVYALARASDPPFKWSGGNRQTWNNMFQSAMRSGRTSHAGRLYSDAVADGLFIHPSAILAAARILSPSIFLERLIGDYLISGSSRENLIKALSQNPSNDRVGLLGIAQRVLPVLPPEIAIIFGRRVVRSNPAAARRLIHSINHPEVITVYNDILTGLSRKAGTPLAPIFEICREMSQRPVKVNARTISIVVRALLEAGRLDDAMLLFKKSLSFGLWLKSAVVGRLMVRLALAQRIPDAEDVERQWRKGFGGWDKGVVGARVLIDSMKGKAVDIGAVEKATGWTPTPKFAAFVHSQTPRRPPEEDFDVRSFWPDSLRVSSFERSDEDGMYRMAVA